MVAKPVTLLPLLAGHLRQMIPPPSSICLLTGRKDDNNSCLLELLGCSLSYLSM